MADPAVTALRAPRLQSLGAVFLLFVVTCAAYLPAVRGGFIWDDNAHVTKVELRTMHGLGRIWFDLGATQQYYPLVHSAFWVEHRLWGDRPVGYHVVNILLHAVAAALVYGLLRRLKIPGAYLAAAVFALHPVQVETVAWITELKNTLSAVFYLTSAWAYLVFDERRRRRWYALALGLFVLGLLTKTVIATLPAALLVLFWWQRGRLSWKRDVLPLAPWFALGAASGLFTAWVERTLIGAEGEAFALTAVERFLLAGRVVWFYLGKLVWPSPLIFIYPRWEVSQGVWWQYLFPLGVGGLLATLWLLRRWRGPLAAMLFFVGTLFPVLGFFNVYPFLFSYVADHFQYLPSLGMITLASAGVALGLARLSRPARLVSQVLVAGLVGVLAILTWRQSGAYSDVETLFRRTLERNPECWLAYNNLGFLLTSQGRHHEAVELLNQALRIRPDYVKARYNLGLALSREGRSSEAIEQYLRALTLMPDFADAHFSLGRELAATGRGDAAIEHFSEAIRIRPTYAEAHYGLAGALIGAGRIDAAIEHYNEALRLRPDAAEVHNDLGAALARMGRTAETIEQCNEALRLRPGFPEALNNLGLALANTGRLSEAADRFRQALALRPDSAEFHNNLAAALAKQGGLAEAIEHYERALTLRPEFAEASNNLGLALARSNRLPEAIDRFRRALRSNPDYVDAHNNLGLALVQVNRVPEALAQFQEALRIKPDFAGARDNLRRAQALLGQRAEPSHSPR